MELTNTNILNTFDYYCLTFYDVNEKCSFFARGLNSSRETIVTLPRDLISSEQYSIFIESVAKELQIFSRPYPSLGKTIRSISYVGAHNFVANFQIIGLNIKENYYEVLQKFETAEELRQYYNSLGE